MKQLVNTEKTCFISLCVPRPSRVPVIVNTWKEGDRVEEGKEEHERRKQGVSRMHWFVYLFTHPLLAPVVNQTWC